MPETKTTVVERKFPTGQLVATPAALDAVPKPELFAAFTRHMRGDWGMICDADKKVNELALRNGGRLLSAYMSSGGVKFWIITEADRSATTILLPSDY